MSSVAEALPQISESSSLAHNGTKRASAGVTYGSAIFLSAFLLFQVELILGKLILPWFGGTPAVWTACLLVFQVLLLAGYSYARLFALKLSGRNQGLAHLVLLGVSVLLLFLLAFKWPCPITPGADWRPGSGESPTWSIIRFLLVAIGVPFLVLAATAPLLQHWFAVKHPGRSPYRLYSLSNFGSFLGLLSYPFLLEPFLRLHTQAWIWTGMYTLFAGICGICAWGAVRLGESETIADSSCRASERVAAPGVSRYLLWTGLAATASVFLLATTNMICQEVAVIPFLWVLPLSLYLLTFILCFESDRWYRPRLFHPLYALAACLACIAYLRGGSVGYLIGLLAYCGLLFIGCMICHGEVAHLKPAPRHLTSFYFFVAVGGALGGLFVSVVAPHIFTDYWELPLAVLACGVFVLIAAVRDSRSWWHESRGWLGAGALTMLTLFLPAGLQAMYKAPAWLTGSVTISAVALAVALTLFLYLQERGRNRRAGELAWARAGAVILLVLLGVGWLAPLVVKRAEDIAQVRNFYGVLSIRYDKQQNCLVLSHGQTIHGIQSLDPGKRRMLLAYYGPYSGINILLRNLPPSPHRIGIIGLGAGSLAALGHAGDYFRFYEINPAEIPFSAGEHPYFTFIHDSAAKVEIVLGDARLSLEEEAARGNLQRFDVLVLDAFSSDAIPTHLLTREAFEIYLKHLNGQGSIIAVHISNKSLNLAPVLAGIARTLGLHAVRIHRPWLPDYSAMSDWVLLSRDPASFSAPEIVQAASPLKENRSLPLWTDDYSNLIRVLR